MWTQLKCSKKTSYQRRCRNMPNAKFGILLSPPKVVFDQVDLDEFGFDENDMKCFFYWITKKTWTNERSSMSMLNFHTHYNAPVLWSCWRAMVAHKRRVARPHEECGWTVEDHDVFLARLMGDSSHWLCGPRCVRRYKTGWDWMMTHWKCLPCLRLSIWVTCATNIYALAWLLENEQACIARLR